MQRFALHLLSFSYLSSIIVQKAPGASWFNGMLEGKFGSSCQVAATFSKLILESLGLKSRIIISRVHLFPVTIIHSLVITEDEEGDLSIIDLGNRLTPLPLSIPLKMAVNEKSEVFEAGDTYTYMIRTGNYKHLIKLEQISFYYNYHQTQLLF